MKNSSLILGMALSAFSSLALADGTAAEFIAQAKAAYAQRAYSEEGIAKAKEAASLYEKAAALQTGREAAESLNGEAEALHFAGAATSEAKKSEKIATHLSGIQVGDRALQTLGVNAIGDLFSPEGIEKTKARLNTEELKTLANAIYFRGANLGQWGTANGVVDSLGKWPELRDSMQAIIDLDMKEVNDFGAYRVLGRGYFKIPALLGGSMRKARRYLTEAVNNTKSTVYPELSRQATNNLYLAEVLHEDKAGEAAKALLQKTIAADAAQLNPDQVPETQDVQKQAAEFLKNW